jgi:hypothetical protein
LFVRRLAAEARPRSRSSGVSIEGGPPSLFSPFPGP